MLMSLWLNFWPSLVDGGLIDEWKENMCHLRVIKHKEILFSEILEIIDIKYRAWPYSLDKQLLWIIDNIQGDDLHLILNDEGINVAYMDMVDVRLKVGSENVDVYGIGNVCSILKGKGYGKELMKQANEYLVDNNKAGLLFCHIPLIKFYEKFGWSLVPQENMGLSICGDETRMMIFNANWHKDEILTYTDRMF